MPKYVSTASSLSLKEKKKSTSFSSSPKFVCSSGSSYKQFTDFVAGQLLIMGISIPAKTGNVHGIYADASWDAELQKEKMYAVDVMVTLTAIAKQQSVASGLLGPIRSSPLDEICSYMNCIVEQCGVAKNSIRLVLVFDGKRCVLAVMGAESIEVVVSL